MRRDGRASMVDKRRCLNTLISGIPKNERNRPEKRSNFRKFCCLVSAMGVEEGLTRPCATFVGRTTTAPICPVALRGERSWEFGWFDVYSWKGPRLFAHRESLRASNVHRQMRGRGSLALGSGRVVAVAENVVPDFTWQGLSDAPQRRVHEMGQYSVRWALPVPYGAPIKGNAHASREESLNFDRNSKEIGRWNDTQ